MRTFFDSAEELVWRINIETKGPLNIKSGEDLGRKEGKPLMRYLIDGEERAFIPGSSLKGVLRSEVERMMKSAKNWYACDPLDRKNTCGKRIEKVVHNGKAVKLSSLSNHEIMKHLILKRRKKEKGLCGACVLFGSTAMKGQCSISDFIPDTTVPILTRTSTAISRENGSVYKRALFPILYVPHGYVFRGSIRISADKELVRFIAGALYALHSGLLSLGAYTSKGFGLVSVEVSREESYKGLEVSSRKVKNTEKFLKEYIKETSK